MANEIIIEAYGKKDLKTVNTELVKMFNCCNRNLGMLMGKLKDIEGVKALSRKSIIGKLSYMGEKNIVPKVDAPAKKDTGPTKKELVSKLVKLLECSIDDIATFNNVKKSEIEFVTTRIKLLREQIEQLLDGDVDNE